MSTDNRIRALSNLFSDSEGTGENELVVYGLAL